MDVTNIVVWGVLWFFFSGIGAAIIFGVFAFLAVLLDKELDGGGIVLMFFGWLFAAAWAIFAIIQVVLHIVQLVQALS